MKGFIFLGLALALAVVLAPPPTASHAQDTPAILAFDHFDLAATRSVNDVEDGTATANIIYEVSNLGPGDGVMFFGRVLGGYEPVFNSPLSAEVDTLDVPLLHPLDFGDPALRMAIVNADGLIIDSQTLSIPYNPDFAAPMPSIADFSTSTSEIDVNELALGQATLDVSWQVNDRLPNTNLRFIQVFDNRFPISVEQPRNLRYVTSSGSGMVSPRYSSSSFVTSVDLVLQVVDIDTDTVIAAQGLRVPVTGDLTVTPIDLNAPPRQGDDGSGFGAPFVVTDLGECQGLWFFQTSGTLSYRLDSGEMAGSTFNRCPSAAEATSPALVHYFQDGSILYIEGTNTIYILDLSGRAAVLPNQYRPGVTMPISNATSGMPLNPVTYAYATVNGVISDLGAPIEGPYEFEVNYQPTSADVGVYQDGLVFDLSTGSHIFLTSNTSSKQAVWSYILP